MNTIKMDCRIKIALIFAITHLIHTSWGASLALSDHLVPPPVPVAQRLRHSRHPTLPPHYDSQAAKSTHVENVDVTNNPENPGFMTRVARWFGFSPDAEPRNQQLTNDESVKYNKNAYYYQQSKPDESNSNAPCSLCNTYPWVPMLPPSFQYPMTKDYQRGNWPQPQQAYDARPAQSTLLQQHQEPDKEQVAQPQQHQQQYVKQRAVHFNFPSPSFLQYHQHSQQGPTTYLTQQVQRPFLPIPIPNLSPSAIPPLYNAVPFHSGQPSLTTTTTTTTTTTASPFSEQQLPSTEPAHFDENIGQHSELQPNSIIPTQIPATVKGNDASFEIIQSHSLTDFVSSVEYPATYSESETIDLGEIPSNHKPQTEAVEANTVKYQHEHFNANLSNRTPASQILTELGNFVGTQQQVTHEPTDTTQIYEETTTPSVRQFERHESNGQFSPADNFPSASSHNLTEIYNNANDIGFWNTDFNDLYTTKTTTEAAGTIGISTQTPPPVDTEFTTTFVEFIPSVQTNLIFEQQQHQQQQISNNPNRDRQTPLRLLDAPIQHEENLRLPSLNAFDPAPNGLDFKLSKYIQSVPSHSVAQWPTTPAPTITVPFLPTPTSTYSAIDASGHFAGMSPPAPPPPAQLPHLPQPQLPPSQKEPPQQIVIPYTTGIQPRPFEPIRNVETTTAIYTYDKWSQSNHVELHEQQESRLVGSATEVPPNTRRTTKYLTKILASNLRELLRKEHEVTNRKNSSSFDFAKLQKNIDDWTEQEYTSLSHRASTPTIRGRSKHIPSEYLTTTTTTTTTPSPRHAKTTKSFDVTELSSSINNLEPLLVGRGSKRFEYEPIDDNRLLDFSEAQSSKIISIRTTAVPRQFTATYIPASSTTTEEPVELWKKARILISPQTKEKVYVVTPQPRFFPQRFAVSSTEAPLQNRSSNGIGFKSPRFLVRPTPGNGTSSPSSSSSQRNSSRNPSSSFYTSAEVFGLTGLSAFVPSEPVEIIDGNSKVTTIATSAPNTRDNGDATSILDVNSLSRTREKPTMSPSPR